MPKYTLTYFDIPGRARLTRALFTLGGVEFEDKRIAKEDWPGLKPSTPLQQLPILDIEGQDTICQSSAIERFAARQAGLAGGNALEAAQIDMLHTSMQDAGTQAIPYFFGPTSQDEEKKEVLRKSLVDEKLPVFFDMFTKVLEANGGGDGFFVGASATLADLAWSGSLQFLKPLDKDGILVAKYPKLVALAERVADIPVIKAWNESHEKK